jgi:hypothetical protein
MAEAAGTCDNQHRYAMMSHRVLPRLLPAMLVTLLFAAAPAAADSWTHVDAGVVAHEGTGQNAAHPLKPADHASKRAQRSASLEEFFEIDDDAEQYFKPLRFVARDDAGETFVTQRPALAYRSTPRTHRACAAFPTGPPHA